MCRILIIYIYWKSGFCDTLTLGGVKKQKGHYTLNFRRTCTLYISLLSKEMIFHYEHFAAYLYILLILTELHWVELRPPKVYFFVNSNKYIYYLIHQM